MSAKAGTAVGWMRKIVKALDIRNQIRKKIVFTCLMILIPSLAIPAISFYITTTNTMEEMMTQNMSDLTESVSQNIESYVDDVEKLTNAPYYSMEMQQTLLSLKYKVGLQRTEAEAKLFNTIDVLLGLRRDIIGLYIFDDTNNRYYKTSLGDVTPFYSFVDQPWFAKIKALGGERLMITTRKADHFVSPDPKYVFSIGRSIISKETNEAIGLILVDMDLQVIRDRLTGLKKKRNTEFYIVDMDGQLVYSYDESSLGEPFGRPELMLKDGENEGTRVMNIDGDRHLVTFSYSQRVGWKYITVTDLEPLLQPNESAIMNNIVISTVVLLILLGVVSLFVSSSMTNPIKKLQKTMLQMGEERFYQVQGIETRDEIGSLVRSYNEMIGRINGLVNTVYKAGIKEKEAQLNALQAQINPHFLYNTLNSIGCMAEVREVPEISVVCKAVSDVFRYSIQPGSNLVTLREELDIVVQYMTIQSFRYDNRIEAIINRDESLLGVKVMKLSLQPIVENAVYHGLEPSRGKGIVIINMELDNDSLLLSVFDNGVGMSEDKLQSLRHSFVHGRPTDPRTKAGGIGLLNVHERIRLYYGERCGVAIDSQEGTGTSVQLRLPYLTDDKDTKEAGL